MNISSSGSWGVAMRPNSIGSRGRGAAGGGDCVRVTGHTDLPRTVEARISAAFRDELTPEMRKVASLMKREWPVDTGVSSRGLHFRQTGDGIDAKYRFDGTAPYSKRIRQAGFSPMSTFQRLVIFPIDAAVRRALDAVKRRLGVMRG